MEILCYVWRRIIDTDILSASDVRATEVFSTGSIQQLREQVRSGAYRAEPESIAAAMLLEVRA